MSPRPLPARLASATSAVLLAAAVAKELRLPADERTWEGALGPVPYDLRPPTLARVVERWWNPDDPRFLTPHVFGVGWSLNLARVAAVCGCSAVRSEDEPGLEADAI